MNEQEILRILSNEFNLHWETGETPKSRTKEFKRRDFFTLKDELETEKITSVIGPRRVGKTTLLFQLIDHLIKEKNIDPKRILYVSMDNDYLVKSSDEPLKDIIDVYLKYVLKERQSGLSGKIYVFLDEIQYLDDWQKKLKSWFDYKYDIKFIISGSSSILIQKDTHHLIGRMNDRIMLPMKFIDVLNYSIKEEVEIYRTIGLELRDGLKLSISNKTHKHLWKSIENVSYQLTRKENEMEKILKIFLIKGGYPELLDKDDYSICSSELKDTIFSKSVLDIIERYKLRNVSLLRYLFSIIASKSGSRLAYTSLSRDLGVERPTIISHLDYLEDAFLISKSSFYSRSSLKKARKEKKYYANDVGMRNSVVGSMNENLFKNSQELGVVAETAVFDHTKRLKFFLSGHQTTDISYWLENQDEIDMILDHNDTPIPIEVKFSNKIGDKDTETIRHFIKKFKAPFGIIVTKNQLEMRDNIVLIPLRIYLLLC